MGGAVSITSVGGLSPSAANPQSKLNLDQARQIAAQNKQTTSAAEQNQTNTALGRTATTQTTGTAATNSASQATSQTATPPQSKQLTDLANALKTLSTPVVPTNTGTGTTGNGTTGSLINILV